MEHKNFPENDAVPKIDLNHISHFVEVNQLAYRDEGKVWIHTDPITRPRVETQVKQLNQLWCAM